MGPILEFVYTDGAEQPWRWRVKADGNFEILCWSESYTSYDAASYGAQIALLLGTQPDLTTEFASSNHDHNGYRVEHTEVSS